MRSLPPPGSGRRDGQLKGQRHGSDMRFGVTSGRPRTLSPREGTHRGISYACGFGCSYIVPFVSATRSLGSRAGLSPVHSYTYGHLFDFGGDELAESMERLPRGIPRQLRRHTADNHGPEFTRARGPTNSWGSRVRMCGWIG